MSDPRYAKQVLFSPIGEAGQAKIGAAGAVLIGCGALGSASANHLARAGIGRLRIVDRDFVELDNLQRQMLYDEEDARRRMPKAVAAAEKLKRINSGVAVEPVVADVHPRNIEGFLAGASVVLDATDNMETRFLLNDACVKNGVPWVYGGALAASGAVLAVVPGATACLRCCLDDLPAPGSMPTCDQAGILNSTTGAVAALQCAAALRLVLGLAPESALIEIDVWTPRFRVAPVRRRADCPACAQRDFPFLSGRAVSAAVTLCGRNMVQISPPSPTTLDLRRMERTLAAAGRVEFNGFLLSVEAGGYELILFPDGRALVKGAGDPAVARQIYARYVGM